MGFLLFIISVILTILTVPLGALYTLIKFSFKLKFIALFKIINAYFYKIALSLDQLGNVSMQYILNDLLITKEGYKFGDEDETISSVLGKNEKLDTLTKTGIFLNTILNRIDPDHSLNSIEEISH